MYVTLPRNPVLHILDPREEWTCKMSNLIFEGYSVTFPAAKRKNE
jgi:hypothetical protein